MSVVARRSSGSAMTRPAQLFSYAAMNNGRFSIPN